MKVKKGGERIVRRGEGMKGKKQRRRSVQSFVSRCLRQEVQSVRRNDSPFLLSTWISQSKGDHNYILPDLPWLTIFSFSTWSSPSRWTDITHNSSGLSLWFYNRIMRIEYLSSIFCWISTWSSPPHDHSITHHLLLLLRSIHQKYYADDLNWIIFSSVHFNFSPRIFSSTSSSSSSSQPPLDTIMRFSFKATLHEL